VSNLATDITLLKQLKKYKTQNADEDEHEDGGRSGHEGHEENVHEEDVHEEEINGHRLDNVQANPLLCGVNITMVHLQTNEDARHPLIQIATSHIAV